MVSRIVAGSVGFVMAPDGALRAGIAVREAIRRCRRPGRPRFCYLGTAAHDPPESAEAVRLALREWEWSSPRWPSPGRWTPLTSGHTPHRGLQEAQEFLGLADGLEV